MKPIRITTALAAALALTFSTTSCDVDQTQAGELPEVDVDVEGGQLPKYDVDAPDVDVGTKQVEVTVPDVDVTPAGEDDDLEDQ